MPRPRRYDQRNQNPIFTDAWEQIIDLGRGVTVDRDAKAIRLELATWNGEELWAEQGLRSHRHGWGIPVLSGVAHRMPSFARGCRRGERITEIFRAVGKR